MKLDLTRRSLIGGAVALAAAGSFPALAAPGARRAARAEGREFDAVIIGAGCAGLVAAIWAADLGARVAVLEKRERPDGNAIYALGTLNAWNTKQQKAQGIKDSREAFIADMMKVSAGRADRRLTETYADRIGPDVDWLADKIGVQFEKIRMSPWPRLGRGHRVTKGGGTGGGTLVKTLLKAARQRKNIEFFFEHPAVRLLTDRTGAVTGVVAKAEGGRRIFRAKGGVLIATGGFSANPEMTDMYIGGWASRLAIRGSRSTTGENISLTKPLRAKLVNMDQFHAGPIVAETHVNPADVLNSMRGIIVDLRGQRFMNEQNTYVIKAKTCAEKTIENKAFAIVDADCPVLGTTIPKFERLHNPYGKADSIEELCKKVGLPPEATRASVDAFNRAVEAHSLEKLNPPNTYRKPAKIEKAPFYAIPFEGGMTATFGGPLINTKAEVQDLDGNTIPGLYAAGNAAGGLFFRDYIGGSQLGGATVFGHIAAEQMAARAKAAKI